MYPPLVTVLGMSREVRLSEVGAVGALLTVIVMVAGGESYFPSLALKVNESSPENPACAV